MNAAVPHASSPSSPQPVQDSGEPAALSSPLVVGETSTRPATAALSVASGRPQQTEAGPGAAGAPPSGRASASERYPEAVEALREKFSKLEARIAALEEGQVDQSQLTDLRELITNTGNMMSPDCAI